MHLYLILLASPLFFTNINGKYPDPHKRTWGYVTVREGAKMFYWLSCAGNDQTYPNYPLVVWLQGGPGASSTGVGNFEEIGTLDSNFNFRKYPWINKTNILFVDSPVGTGFSYINKTYYNNTHFASNVTQVVDDLMAFTKVFFEKNPEFQKVPMHIFGEGYGGKVATRYSYALYKAMNTGKIPCQIKSVTLGNAWISPLDSIKSWGKFLYATSFVDSKGQADIDTMANKIETLLMKNNYTSALSSYFKMIDLISNLTNRVSLFNILDTTDKNPKHSTKDICNIFNNCFASPELIKFMNEKIKNDLHGIPDNFTWGEQASDVLDALKLDYLRSSIESVDLLLNRTNLKVAVYTSQLDLLVDVFSTLSWMDKLLWPGMPAFKAQPRIPFTLSDNSTGGFRTRFKTLTLYWLLKAEHMTGKYSGETAFHVLSEILAG